MTAWRWARCSSSAATPTPPSCVLLIVDPAARGLGVGRNAHRRSTRFRPRGRLSPRDAVDDGYARRGAAHLRQRPVSNLVASEAANEFGQDVINETWGAGISARDRSRHRGVERGETSREIRRIRIDRVAVCRIQPLRHRKRRPVALAQPRGVGRPAGNVHCGTLGGNSSSTRHGAGAVLHLDQARPQLGHHRPRSRRTAPPVASGVSRFQVNRRIAVRDRGLASNSSIRTGIREGACRRDT